MNESEHELLVKLRDVLKPLDSKIDFSLHIGTTEQMRADLTYMRRLLGDARAAIDELLIAEAEAAKPHSLPADYWESGK